MARLPVPQGDDDVWGVILNDFLSVSHDTDGTLKTHTHTAANVSDFSTATDARIAAQKGVANGIAGLDATTRVSIAQLPTGTTSTTVSLGNHGHTSTQISDFAIAADARITAQKGVASGIATLDVDGKVPASQLPAATNSYTSRMIGEIISWPGVTTPSGWLVCDGAALNRTVYATLFAAIGTTYGAGDGTTTFNLPDLKGRSLMGLDAGQVEFDALGKTGGAKAHTLAESEIPSHTHIQNSHNHTQNAHTHTQDAHNHTQNSHNHTQNSHNHTQDAHNHGQLAHAHQQGHATTSGGQTGLQASGIGLSGTTLNYQVTGDTTATNIATTATNNATTATNIATTAINNATTATNQSTVATNIATTATNQNTGGGLAHNNLHPFLVTKYIIKASYSGGEVDAPVSHTHTATEVSDFSSAVQTSLPTANATTAGIVELATTAEALTGTDTTRAVTPAGLVYMGSVTNADTALTTGRYYAAGASALTGKPTGASDVGLLEVFGFTNYLSTTQTSQRYTDSNNMAWKRHKIGNTWGSWTQLAEFTTVQTAFTYATGWADYDTVGSFAGITFSKSAGVVTLRGLARVTTALSATASAITVGTLPIGYRPPSGAPNGTLIFLVHFSSGNGGTVRLDVQTSGVVTVQANGAAHTYPIGAYLSVSGVSFVVG